MSHDKVAFASLRAGVAPHLDLLGPTQNRACDVILYNGVQVCLVYNGENIVITSQGEGDKARVLENKNIILGIADDRRSSRVS